MTYAKDESPKLLEALTTGTLDATTFQAVMLFFTYPGPNIDYTIWFHWDVWGVTVADGRAGFVLDYIAHSTSSLTNYQFKTDRTYFITNGATVNFYGTTVLEGAVIKMGASSYMNFNGPVDCRTDTYRPAFVTAVDDDSVGEKIPGSTGTPSGYYGYQPIGLKDTSAVYNLHDLRVRHCNYAFTMYGNVRADFSHHDM